MNVGDGVRVGVEAGGGGTRRRAMREGDVGVEAAMCVIVGVARRGHVPPYWRREVGRRRDALLAPSRSLWAVAMRKVHHPHARRLSCSAATASLALLVMSLFW